ncbi:transmembrane amino acid transporter protein-domain-containing protein [Gorgonomyces haynaldii]|nr:transmembrane amino acid transporter protein-domain-containing protein [Gorgonomyces haynaldii]
MQTTLNACIDLINTILGTGLISLPFAFAVCGLGTSTLLLLVAVLSTWYSLHLLVTVAEQALSFQYAPRTTILTTLGEPSYSGLAHLCMGPIGQTLADGCMFLACLGFATSYLVSIGDVMPPLASLFVSDPTLLMLFENRLLWMFLFLVLIYPLACSKRVEDYWWFSGLCLLCAIYLALLVLFNCSLQSRPQTEPWFKFPEEGYQTLGIFIFAFTCHQNIFSIYADMDALYLGHPLDSRKLNQIKSVVNVSVFSVGFLYLVIGITGYYALGSDAKIISIDNFPPNLFTFVGRIAYAMLAALSFPIQAHPDLPISRPSSTTTRRRSTPRRQRSLSAVYEPLNSNATYSPSLTAIDPPPTKDTRQRTLTWIIIVLSYGFAILVPNLDTILSIVGASGGVYICFILPCIFYHKLGPDLLWQRVGALLMGFCATILSLVLCYHLLRNL